MPFIGFSGGSVTSGGSGSGVTQSEGDGYWLKLDSSNGPLTGTLGVGSGSKLQVTTDGYVLSDFGHVLTPSYSFKGDADTGLYRIVANNIGVVTNGILRFDVSTTDITSTLPFVGPNGIASAPAYTFTGDSAQTGMWRTLAGNIGFSKGGSEVVEFTSTSIQGPAGAATTPTHGFFLDVDTGMFNPAANTLGFSTGGTERLRINSDGYTLFSDGYVGTPAMSFLNDTDTGIYKSASNTINFTTGGAEAFRVNSSGQILSNLSGGGTNGFSFTGQTGTGMTLITSSRLGFYTTSLLCLDLDNGAKTATFSNTPTIVLTGSNAAVKISTGGTAGPASTSGNSVLSYDNTKRVTAQISYDGYSYHPLFTGPFAIKAADETKATATLADDVDLTVTVDALSRYEVAFDGYVQSTSGNGFNFSWGGTTTVANVCLLTEIYGNQFGVTTTYLSQSLGLAKQGSSSGAGFGQTVHTRGILDTGATGGTFKLQWCNDSGSSTLKLFKGARLRLTKV